MAKTLNISDVANAEIVRYESKHDEKYKGEIHFANGHMQKLDVENMETVMYGAAMACSIYRSAGFLPQKVIIELVEKEAKQ